MNRPTLHRPRTLLSSLFAPALVWVACGFPPIPPQVVQFTQPLAAEPSGEMPDSGDKLQRQFPGQERLQHLSRLGLAAWHRAGTKGRGIKAAVLDSGFRGYRDHLGVALPQHVVARSFRKDGNLEAKDSRHGILCAEVLHAVAPESDLYLANWEPDCPESFLAAVRWAREQGVRVISCSVIMPHWSDGEGNGPHHATLAELLGDDGLFFASAGNVAQRHWAGSLRLDTDGLHQWQSGLVENVVTPWGTDRVSIELCAPAGIECEAVLSDYETGRVVQRAATEEREASMCHALLQFLPMPGRRYALKLRSASVEPFRIHVTVLGGSLRHATAEGSIPFPGDGPEVIAVGAVNAEGERTAYSACGPNSRSPKPDHVAPVPFPSLWRPQPFSGTSAAAPQAAALAAVLWSRNPTWTAGAVRAALRRSSRDLGPTGHDHQTGFGMISLPTLD